MKNTASPSHVTGDSPAQVRRVRLKLTCQEREECAMHLVQALGNLSELRAEKKDWLKAFKSRCEIEEGRAIQLRSAIAEGYDYRERQVVVKFHPGEGRKTYHLATEPDGPAVDSEPMKEEDYQLSFPPGANVHVGNR